MNQFSMEIWTQNPPFKQLKLLTFQTRDYSEEKLCGGGEIKK